MNISNPYKHATSTLSKFCTEGEAYDLPTTILSHLVFRAVFCQIKFGWDWQMLDSGRFLIFTDNIEKLWGIKNLADLFSNSSFVHELNQPSEDVDNESESDELEEYSQFKTVILNDEISEKIRAVLESCKVLIDPYQGDHNVLCHSIEEYEGEEVVNTYYRNFPYN